ncbi:hypothetical protein [Candidatus Nitrotoga fabula]|uniref:hypothetical protein n=1 Tax=Candidatus Nitrotoga fabula TaxID=2182327 RepID=UPI001BB470A8|nr:hypothetical protein [Candidatus Nitrotoga fabula]
MSGKGAAQPDRPSGNHQTVRAVDRAAKSEGAALYQPRFAAPRRRRGMLTLTCVAGFTRTGRKT